MFFKDTSRENVDNDESNGEDADCEVSVDEDTNQEDSVDEDVDQETSLYKYSSITSDTSEQGNVPYLISLPYLLIL